MWVCRCCRSTELRRRCAVWLTLALRRRSTRNGPSVRRSRSSHLQDQSTRAPAKAKHGTVPLSTERITLAWRQRPPTLRTRRTRASCNKLLANESTNRPSGHFLAAFVPVPRRVLATSPHVGKRAGSVLCSNAARCEWCEVAAPSRLAGSHPRRPHPPAAPCESARLRL